MSAVRTPTPRVAANPFLPLELRASISLAMVFALRMLGLFLVLPVFATEARNYQGGDDPLLIGLAMGMYGLTQAMLQAPLGIASDRWGRKKIILLGLGVFAIGSVCAALTDSVMGLLLGRALQGAGAVSAAVTALLSDFTRDVVRTKAMAMIGASIGLTFAISLMIAPPLVGWFGLSGLFFMTAALTLLGMVVVAWVIPPEPRHLAQVGRVPFASVLRHPDLWRLNLGVFVLHAVQMSMWVVVPGMLLQAGLASHSHWQVYVPAVGLSLLMMGLLFSLERRGHLAWVLRGAVALLLLVQLLLLGLSRSEAPLSAIGVALFLFFSAFNALEASQPSLISRLAPPQARGTALGIYNTAQSLGLFAGGAVGGLVFKLAGAGGLFLLLAALLLLWLSLAWHQPVRSAPQA